MSTERGYKPAFIKDDLYDETLSYFEQPHTLSAVLIVLLVVIFYAFYWKPSSEIEAERLGALAAGLSFLAFSAINMRDSFFFRPHPIFWRIVLGMNVLYMMWIVFMLFQPRNRGIELMKFFHSDLGIELDERSYGENCALTLSNIYANIDEFVIAHYLGWVVKVLMLRDPFLAFITSAFFELIELTFKNHLPNFDECWWDSLFLDLLGCNLLGILTGMFLINKLEMLDYSFLGFFQSRGVRAKTSAIIRYLTMPSGWTKFNWLILKNIKYWTAFWALILFQLIADLNAFYLKFVLHVPPDNVLNTIRLTILGLQAFAATREFYEFIVKPKQKRLGTAVFLVLILALEICLIVKYRAPNMFNEPFPPMIVLGWSIFFFIFTTFTIYYFLIRHPEKFWPIVTGEARRAAIAAMDKERRSGLRERSLSPSFQAEIDGTAYQYMERKKDQ